MMRVACGYKVFGQGWGFASLSLRAVQKVLELLLCSHHLVLLLISDLKRHWKQTEDTAAMARKYLGGSGERLTIWISVAASTVLIFYGYGK